MPKLTRGEWFDLGRVIFWIALVVPAYLLGWLDIVVFVSLLSLWALVESAWAAYRANNKKAFERIEQRLERIERLLSESVGRGSQ